ncbi:two-component system response regulator YesN [Paenibacillus taihuensis]|uniref:Two-component system response regulator YesN n=1 Tax=Paenibacillus taihuensis TaxID=1156355 RepID=A0A3D9S3T2_9BACL|nr:helix-turn-helix domain-containing protein [Paenibacillus taihuensis]REE87445.1 two-component system response regulator YesN [Paenibacillus taihuensis]
MYRVMVVDDEQWSRKSISKMISELALDVEVIAEARNGEEALALIPIRRPHIIVTDMNMPVLDGGKFLEALHERFGEIKVIVISGYSQFEYMKAAVTYQACEYVMKPVAVKELEQALNKAIQACKTYTSLQQQKRFNQEALHLKRETFLQTVTSQRITNTADIQREAGELGITAHGDYRVAVCMFRQFSEVTRTKFHGNADLFLFSLENILYEVMREDKLQVYKSDDRTRICLLFPVASYDEARVQQLLHDYHEAVSRMLLVGVVAGLSRAYARLEELPAAYQSANDALRNNRLLRESFAFSSAEHPEAASPVELLSTFGLKSLRQAIGANNAKDFKRLLNEYYEKARKQPDASIRQIGRDLRQIIELLLSEMKGIEAAQSALFDADEVSRILDVKELQTFLSLLTQAIEAYCATASEADNVRSVRKITMFLDEHYFEDFSLIDVATRFHMDAAYLSKLFKSITNENFTEYVTRKRMEKACELLKSSENKINEISELVGYENQRYFSQVFKRFTGQTPSEYRDGATVGTAERTKY